MRDYGQQTPNEMVSGIVVKKSPIEALAKALGTAGAGYYQGKANRAEDDMIAQRNAKIAEILSGGNNLELAQLSQIDPELALQTKLKMMSATSSTPAAMQMADAYLNAIQSGDTQRAQALREFAKTQDKGLVQLSNGNFAPLSGYGEALGQIGQSKKFGETMGARQADLLMNPQIKAAEMQAENLTTARSELPQSQANANEVLGLINSIRNDKGFEASVGLRNPMEGALPFGVNIAGSPAADFQAKIDQLGGKQFLEAFQSLKGGGQITEIEGKKATNAIARMQTSQSEQAFRQALDEFEGIVRGALQRSQQKAQMPQSMSGGTMSLEEFLNE